MTKTGFTRRALLGTSGALSGNAVRARPSQANFVLVDLPSPDAARGAVTHLAAQGLLVRGFGPGAHAAQPRTSIGAGPASRRRRPARIHRGRTLTMADPLPSPELPQGAFTGYALNRLPGLAPDEEITRMAPARPRASTFAWSFARTQSAAPSSARPSGRLARGLGPT